VQKNRRYELYRSELVMFSVQPFAPHITGNCDDILTHPPQVILTVLRRQIGTESLISYVRERHVEFFPPRLRCLQPMCGPSRLPLPSAGNSLLRQNHSTYQRQYAQWNRSFICERCRAFREARAKMSPRFEVEMTGAARLEPAASCVTGLRSELFLGAGHSHSRPHASLERRILLISLMNLLHHSIEQLIWIRYSRAAFGEPKLQ
jgi:hypothetical protein